MLTSIKTLLVSILLSLLLSHGKGDTEQKTTQNTTEGNRKENESFPLEYRIGESKENDTSILDPSNEIHEATETLEDNFSTDSSGTLRSTTTFSTSSPLTDESFSKSVINSSVADGNLGLVSAPPNVTPAVSSENFTFLVNETMKTDNSSISVSALPPTSSTVSMTSKTMQPDGWLTITGDSTVGLTPYEDTTTLQPTSKFTNDSKIFPNASDPQEENRNTGVVFGAILGAILGASLLSLVGYLLCGKRKMDSFSHRRLYDDRNEPVLRLDNAPEPYDVSFGNSSYYNSSMNDSSIAAGREDTRDSIPMDDIPPLRTSV